MIMMTKNNLLITGGLLLAASLAHPQELPTKHDAQYTAIYQSTEGLRVDGCVRSKPTRKVRWVKERRDKNTYWVTGAEFEVKCLEWEVEVVEEDPVEPLKTINISWTIPTRENGDTLSIFDISYYEIRWKISTDALWTVEIIDSDATQWTLNPSEAGTYQFMIFTIDAGGLYSVAAERSHSIEEG